MPRQEVNLALIEQELDTTVCFVILRDEELGKFRLYRGDLVKGRLDKPFGENKEYDKIQDVCSACAGDLIYFHGNYRKSYCAFDSRISGEQMKDMQRLIDEEVKKIGLDEKVEYLTVKLVEASTSVRA